MIRITTIALLALVGCTQSGPPHVTAPTDARELVPAGNPGFQRIAALDGVWRAEGDSTYFVRFTRDGATVVREFAPDPSFANDVEWGGRFDMSGNTVALAWGFGFPAVIRDDEGNVIGESIADVFARFTAQVDSTSIHFVERDMPGMNFSYTWIDDSTVDWWGGTGESSWRIRMNRTTRGSRD